MKTGYHSVYAINYFDGINAAAENSFDFAQFELGVPAFFLDALTAKSLKNIRNYAHEKNVEITFHAPGDNVSLYCDYPLIRQGILDQFKLILEKANILNARHLTIHSGNYSSYKKSGKNADGSFAPPNYFEDVLCENINYLVDNAGDTLICVENHGFNETARNALRRLLAENNRLFLTLDAAKLYGGNELIKEDYMFFRENKDRIREIHIHDLIPCFRSHQTVGTGIVDFNLFKEFLNEDVYLNFEVRPVEEAKISKDRLFQIWMSRNS